MTLGQRRFFARGFRAPLGPPIVAGMTSPVKRYLAALLIALLGFGLAPDRLRAANASDSASEAVRVIGSELAAAAETGQQDSAAGRAAMAAVLDQWFSVRSMALAALPDPYRDAADAAYVAAYQRHLTRAFVTRSLSAGTGRLEPIGERALERVTIVGANVIEDGRIVRLVEFLMTRADTGFRVVNVTVEGLLVTAQQQNDFRPHLDAGGLPALIAHLEGGT